jgi:hypothetical protein
MNKSKLYELLRSFSGHDYNRALKFVASPFYNEDQDVISLYNYFYQKDKCNLPFDERKEKVFKSVFPDRSCYDDKKFRYVQPTLFRHGIYFHG